MNQVLLHLHLAWPLPVGRDSLRHHLLPSVVFNLQRDGDHYRDCPLPVAVPRDAQERNARQAGDSPGYGETPPDI